MALRKEQWWIAAAAAVALPVAFLALGPSRLLRQESAEAPGTEAVEGSAEGSAAEKGGLLKRSLRLLSSFRQKGGSSATPVPATSPSQSLEELKQKLLQEEESAKWKVFLRAKKLPEEERISFVQFALAHLQGGALRKESLHLLADSRTAAILPMLFLCAKDDSAAVREEAFSQLTHFGSGRMAALEKSLQNSGLPPADWQRRLAGEALRPAETAQLAALLVAGVHDASSAVRESAWEAAHGMPDKVQAQTLERILESAPADTKRKALQELAAEPGLDTLPALFRALEDSDQATAQAAAETLRRTLGRNFTGSAQAEAWWRANAGSFSVGTDGKVTGRDVAL